LCSHSHTQVGGRSTGWIVPMAKGNNRCPSNYRMQQTVRPVTPVAGQRPRQAVPQLTRERYEG